MAYRQLIFTICSGKTAATTARERNSYGIAIVIIIIIN